jgi:hypothetical protein
MWVPTKSEAVEMFARHFEARHRSGAVQRAKDTARNLKSQGDEQGYEIWCEVAGRVARIRNTEAAAARRQVEAV